MMRALLYGALIMILTNGAFAWLATQEDAITWKLLVTVFFDNVSAGMCGTAFIAYMSSIASREYAATQYALMTSAWALFNKTAAGFSGVLYDFVGSVNFFLITAGLGLPAIALLLYIWRYGTPLARGSSQPQLIKSRVD
jgi:PAT family beta-lactamase induction signal transducer AmpG